MRTLATYCGDAYVDFQWSSPRLIDILRELPGQHTTEPVPRIHDNPHEQPPEAELLQQAQARRLRFVRFCMLAVAGFAMLQQAYDFLAFDFHLKVFYIFGVRTIFVLVTLYLTWLLGTEESESKWDHGILAFWLGVSAIGALYPFLHPVNDTIHFYFEMALVFLMYTLLPAHRFARRIPAMVLTAGCMFLLYDAAPFLPTWYVTFLALGFLLSNLLGLWVAKRLRGVTEDLKILEPMQAYDSDRPATWHGGEDQEWAGIDQELANFQLRSEGQPE